MVAALTEQGAPAPVDRLSSAKWPAVTAIASALAHGYAHLIARRGDQTVHGVRAAARLLLSEWPLVLATAPTLVLLLGAARGWWPSRAIEDVALAVNVVLFAWGACRPRRRPYLGLLLEDRHGGRAPRPGRRGGRRPYQVGMSVAGYLRASLLRCCE